MIDDSLIHNSSTDPRRNWARMREKMRETIRAELDRIDPTDDARRALELIIESSLRPSEVDGQLKLTVIDHNGKPRMLEKDGQQREFTLQDLLEELRGRYAVLFRPARPDAAARAQPEHHPERREKPQRDWLSLDAEGPQPRAESPRLPVEPVPLQIRAEEPRLHGWFRNALSRPKTVPAPGPGAEPHPEEFASAAAGYDSTVPDAVPARSWLRPSLALAAVAVLALLGIGAFLFRSDEPAPQQASAPTAAETSDVAASPIREPEPSTTGSTASSGALRGVPDVIDTATLSLKGEVVRLFGVEWAPGAGKPEDLARYLNGREVACSPAGPNDVYRCQVGEQDLSRVVLFNGGGRPTSDATPELKAAADKAREAKIGVWSVQP